MIWPHEWFLNGKRKIKQKDNCNDNTIWGFWSWKKLVKDMARKQIKNIQGGEQEIEVKLNEIICDEFLPCETLCCILVKDLIDFNTVLCQRCLPIHQKRVLPPIVWAFVGRWLPRGTKFPSFLCEYSHMSEF